MAIVAGISQNVHYGIRYPYVVRNVLFGGSYAIITGRADKLKSQEQNQQNNQNISNHEDCLLDIQICGRVIFILLYSKIFLLCSKCVIAYILNLLKSIGRVSLIIVTM
jgi:hypothetical protein